MGDSKDFTIFIRNFDSKQVTHDLLLELFTQAGPVQNLTLKEDFAFLEFEDQESVIYACNLLNDTVLFGIPLQVKPRNGSKWENQEMFTFPNQNSFNIDNRSSNNSFNEPDFRQNHHFTSNFSELEFRQNVHSYNETDYRQNGRTFNENEYRHNSRGFNEHDYRQNVRPHSNNNHNKYIESDFRQVNRQPNNQLPESAYRYVSVDLQRPFATNKSLQDRRFINQESQWYDKRPNTNKTFGNYRDKPY